GLGRLLTSAFFSGGVNGARADSVDDSSTGITVQAEGAQFLWGIEGDVDGHRWSRAAALSCTHPISVQNVLGRLESHITALVIDELLQAHCCLRRSLGEDLLRVLDQHPAYRRMFHEYMTAHGR